MAEYYVRRSANGRVEGPMTREQVQELARAGGIGPDGGVGKSPEGPWRKVRPASPLPDSVASGAAQVPAEPVPRPSEPGAEPPAPSRLFAAFAGFARGVGRVLLVCVVSLMTYGLIKFVRSKLEDRGSGTVADSGSVDAREMHPAEADLIREFGSWIRSRDYAPDAGLVELWPSECRLKSSWRDFDSDSFAAIIQLRDLVLEPEALEVSDADRLNGFKWRVLLRVTHGPWREKPIDQSGGEWSPWQDGGDFFQDLLERDSLRGKAVTWQSQLPTFNTTDGYRVMSFVKLRGESFWRFVVPSHRDPLRPDRGSDDLVTLSFSGRDTRRFPGELWGDGIEPEDRCDPFAAAGSFPSETPSAPAPEAGPEPEWFVAGPGNTPVGPMTLDQLKQDAANGRLARTTYVLKRGSSSWQVAAKVPGLFP